MGAGAVRSQQPSTDNSRGDSVSGPVQSYLSSSIRPLQTAIMACQGCSIRFSLLKRKKFCSDCGRYFCSACSVKIVGGLTLNALRRCSKCQEILRGDFTKQDLMVLRVKDLRFFLSKKNIPIRTCTEKDHLVELVFLHFANNYHQNRQREHEQHVVRLAERMQEENAEERRQRLERLLNMEDESNPPENETEEERAERLRERQDREMIETMDRLREELDEQEENSDSRPSNVRANLNDIKTIEDIDQLTVKQLKEVLATNFVDYKGCCEKYELAERVERLWKENQSDQKRVKDILLSEANTESTTTSTADEELCKICMDAPVECVLLECGHMVTCTKCGRRLAECPICRQNVVRAVRIFRS